VLGDRLVFEAYVRKVDRLSWEVGGEKGSSRRWKGVLLVCEYRDLSLDVWQDCHGKTAGVVHILDILSLRPVSLLRHIARMSVVVNKILRVNLFVTTRGVRPVTQDHLIHQSSL